MPRAPDLASPSPDVVAGRPARRRIPWQVIAVVIVVVAGLGLLAADLRGSLGPRGAGTEEDQGDITATDGPALEPPPVRYPDETTTGVPAGVVLQPSGSLTITQPGAVIDSLEITGTVVVAADNVTIKNSRINNTGSIAIKNEGENLLVVDTEIDGQGGGIPAIAFNSYTLLRVNIHDVGEGPRIAGGDVTIEDSYVHHLVQVDGNHTDVIQAVGGSNIVIRGNNLLAYNPDTGKKGNAAFMFGEDDNPLRDCLVEDNYMNGGNYTVNGGGGGTEGAACTFRRNEFGPDFRYGTRANLGPNVSWGSTNFSR
ncbi:right-handed parallel beta-helix repeat-containing protein [Pengzhenrongella frigida]|uniref:Right-handed parallel beta-helix repeat-containing protein n=1 Tax=Pengzhenrongella frigida TaxID=1259133 RepID=A0A4Q5MV21_9MICO|nr:right-handed parallel beta-helix repeat-containing protein [Cellulomonas sp. HLT2-17]RYV49388.1 right-handed parallel beta-helix repeat-containing protein [Cellulomonas sp. HLT2-17]